MTLTGYIVGTKGNTGRGIASIVENADYTITINLTDGTSYTTAPIAGFTAVDFDENYDLVVTKTDGTTETVETDIADYNALLKGYKDDAETAATNANTYQGWAQDYANNAQAQAGYASAYKQAAYDSKVAAGTSETNAGTQALKSEGYAVGKQNGTDVSSGSDYYHNNAKYYSDLASTAETNAGTSESNASTHATNANADALKAEGYAVGKQNGTTVISGTYYHNNAQYYNSQATNMASLATNKANSAGTDALKAEGFSVGEQNGTPVTSDSDYYENNAKYYSEEAAASAASLVIEDALDEDSTNALENGVITKEFAKKANIDGAYESMTVGNAEQLVSTVFVNDEDPYNFRTSGGSADIGDREYDTIVGGTVAWNQLAPEADFSTHNHWWKGNGCDSVTFSNGIATVVTLQDPSPATIYNRLVDCDGIGYVKDHAYLACYEYKLNAQIPSGIVPRATIQTYLPMFTTQGKDVTSNNWETFARVFKATESSGTSSVLTRFKIDMGASYTDSYEYQLRRPQVFDLTAMFGSTIADYIYSLEQATAGAGVAWFKKLFPKPYYAYNAGELMSVNTSAHNTVGFNAWDEEWENGQIYSSGSEGADANSIRSKNYCGCVPNTIYHGKTPSTCLLCWYDESKAFIGRSDATNSNVISPSNARYFRISCPSYGSTYQNNICVNLSWDGERDGEYEAYVKRSYPLDSDLTLRGIPKLDASNNLYYDGDTYESDGSVTRKYGVVTLDGTVTYGWSSNNAVAIIQITNGIITDATTQYNAYTLNDNAEFKDSPWVGRNVNAPCIGMFYGMSYLFIKSADIESSEDAKTYFTNHPTTVQYELATPTTETADPYTNPQIVDDFGTEEYVDYAVSQGDRDVSIPVGHYTQYMANLKAKLEMSPNSPEGAGDYIVRQTNGENEYVTLASNATIQDIIARLEALEGGE